MVLGKVWSAYVTAHSGMFWKPERLKRSTHNKTRSILSSALEGKLPYTKLQARKWALLERDLDFVIISDVIRRRF